MHSIYNILFFLGGTTGFDENFHVNLLLLVLPL